MLRAPVLPEFIEVHAGLALDKCDRLDHESMPRVAAAPRAVRLQLERLT
jgi:hypothetical protein